MAKETAAETEKLSTGGISLAMRQRYKLADGYAMIEEVGNATGHRCNRHADAIVMNLWPSRGLEIMGFEYKASRSDWVKELKTPEKADPIFQYCDRWYLVVGDPAIVKEGELPINWGLLTPLRCFEGNSDAFTLKESVAAAKLEPKSLDRSFVGAMLRSAAKESVPDKMLKDARSAGYSHGCEDGRKFALRDLNADHAEFERFKEVVKKFEAASGMTLMQFSDGEKIGEMVKIAHQLMENGGFHSLERLLERADEAAKELKSGTRGIREEVRKYLRERVDQSLLPAATEPEGE